MHCHSVTLLQNGCKSCIKICFVSWWWSLAGRLHTQWWNKRRSVCTNVMPWSSHALMTSSSFVEPAGLAIYWTPLWNTIFKQTSQKSSSNQNLNIFTARYLPLDYLWNVWDFKNTPQFPCHIKQESSLTKRKWKSNINMSTPWVHCTMRSSLLDTELHIKLKCIPFMSWN